MLRVSGRYDRADRPGVYEHTDKICFSGVMRCKCDLVGSPAGSMATDAIVLLKVSDCRCENKTC